MDGKKIIGNLHGFLFGSDICFSFIPSLSKSHPSLMFVHQVIVKFLLESFHSIKRKKCHVAMMWHGPFNFSPYLTQ